MKDTGKWDPRNATKVAAEEQANQLLDQLKIPDCGQH